MRAGINGINKNIIDGYVGINGANKKIKQVLVGISGVNKEVWSSSNIKIYGYTIDELNSNPETAVTYTSDAVGKTPAAAGGAFCPDWDTEYPFNAIRPVLFKDGQVIVELNKSDYSKDIDGNPIDIISGNAGDVMIEFPIIFWKMWKMGSTVSAQIATGPVDESFKPLAHTIGTQIREKIYIGAYLSHRILDSGIYRMRSLSDKAPLASLIFNYHRTFARNNGPGYEQLGYYQILMLQHLFLLRFKNRNSQVALGRGYVDGNSAAVNTGGANTKGMYFGEATGKQQLKCFGIEDLWGNLRCWVDGMCSDSNGNILISNQSFFNDTGTGYGNFGQASMSLNGYMSTIQGGTESGFVIKAMGGSATTNYCDYATFSGSKIPLFGGYWSTGDSSGIFRMEVAHSPSSGISSAAGRLVFLG